MRDTSSGAEEEAKANEEYRRWSAKLEILLGLTQVFWTFKCIIHTVSPLCRYTYTDWIWLHKYTTCATLAIRESCVSPSQQEPWGVECQRRMPGQRGITGKTRHNMQNLTSGTLVTYTSIQAKWVPSNSFSQCFSCCRDIFVLYLGVWQFVVEVSQKMRRTRRGSESSNL